MIDHFSQQAFEGTFHIEDADLEVMAKVLADVNIKECPYFDLSDKYGNSARYYRENQWIPVSERLPEDGKEVQVTSGFEETCIYVTDGKFSSRFGGWVSAWDNLPLCDVTAWMPLPEPYMEEE